MSSGNRHKPQTRSENHDKKPPLTHFLCIPLVTPTSKPIFEASLKRFAEEAKSLVEALAEDAAAGEAIRAKINARAILGVLASDRAVRPVGTLHLTLGVMSLNDADGEEQGKGLEGAIQLLKDIDVTAMLRGSEAVGGDATDVIKIDLKGLNSMHGATRTSALYTAPTDTSGRLASLCERLQKLFIDEGFVINENRVLKLHATVINSLYARSGGYGHQEDHDSSSERNVSGQTEVHKRRTAPVKFDARDLLSHFEDFEWASDLQLDRIAICEMGARMVKDDDGRVVGEAYTEVATRSLLV